MNFPVIEDRSTAIPSTRKFELEKLTREEIILVLNSLATLGSVDWKQGTESILVLHFSAFEFADEVYRWAKENYLIGDVETIDFISNGKSTGKHESKWSTNLEFYNQPKEVILKAVSVLEKQGKAQLIDMGNGDYSVKFLWYAWECLNNSQSIAAADDVELTLFVSHVEHRHEEVSEWQVFSLLVLRVALLDVELLLRWEACAVWSLLDRSEFLDLLLDLFDGLVAL